MFIARLRTADILTIIIAILAVVAAAGGLMMNDLYRDNAFVKSAWRGNDWVTLVVAVPLLMTSLWMARRGSLRAQLIWLGTLDYMLYNFAFYLFGAAFNDFFLLYVALFSLSIFALISGLTGIEAKEISQKFNEHTPVKWISGYLLFVASGLGAVYIIQSLNFIFTRQLPGIVNATQHPTSVVFALDLSLVIPWFIIGAIWLWQRRPWGYIIAAISLIKGASYTLVLTAGSFVAVRAGIPDAATEIPLWAALTTASLIALLTLLKNLPSARTKSEYPSAQLQAHQ